MRIKEVERALNIVNCAVAPWKKHWQSKDNLESFSVLTLMRPTNITNHQFIIADMAVRLKEIVIHIDIPAYSKCATVKFSDFPKLERKELIDGIKVWMDSFLEERGYIIIEA